jgi:hypothetical protein
MTRKTNSTSILASVVFLKIQEFARRPVQEQARLRAQLEAVAAVTAAELEPAGRIVLDASDGVAIVVLRDPKGALRLAERALNAVAAGLPLCAGINHGAVKLAGGRRGDEGMIGDGIAVAASVAEFASPLRLLISRSFRDALADVAPGIEAGLAPAGTFTDAGLRTHELFSPDRNAAARRRRRFLALGAASMVAFIGAGVAVRLSTDREHRFLDDALAKVRHSTRQSEAFLRGLVQKAKF